MSAEVTREFLDTNVLVYAHDSSAGYKRDQALALLERVVSERTAVLSVQVLQEFFVTVTRKLPRPLPAVDAAVIVADLSTLPTHSPDGNDVLAAIDLHQRAGISFWDSMVLHSAARMGAALLWSEDLAGGGVHDGVEVRSPFD